MRPFALAPCAAPTPQRPPGAAPEAPSGAALGLDPRRPLAAAGAALLAGAARRRPTGRGGLAGAGPRCRLRRPSGRRPAASSRRRASAQHASEDLAGPRRFPSWLVDSAVPRLPADDPAAIARVRDGLPVVLAEAPLCGHVLGKWSFEYLEAQMAGHSECIVHVVPKDRCQFQRVYGKGLCEGAVMHMSFADFVRQSASEGSPHAYYMQGPLLGDNGFSAADHYGDSMRADVDAFSWSWLRKVFQNGDLGDMELHQFWVARNGALTPCHHDSRFENLHAQILGCKRFLLIPPDQTFHLYPYPIDHPLDRFSMVDFEDPCLERFPGFASVRGLEAVLSPGDVLYIPKYWWHHVTQGAGENASLNFWCDQQLPSDSEDDEISCLSAMLSEGPAACRPLIAHRAAEALASDAWVEAYAAKALPRGMRPGELLTLAAGSWPADARPELRAAGAGLRRALAEALGSEAEAAAVLEGTAAGGRLHPGPPRPSGEVVDASGGEVGGWLSRSPA